MTGLLIGLASLAVLGWVCGVVEWVLIHGLSNACPRIGVTIASFSGGIGTMGLPKDLDARIWGVQTRQLPDGRVLIRTRSWWEKGASADPGMNLAVAVLRARADGWELDVRHGIGFLIFFGAIALAALKESWLGPVLWAGFCGVVFTMQYSRTRNVFRRITDQIGRPRVEQLDAADERRGPGTDAARS